MRVLDLFAGLGGWSNVARERGHDVRTLDNDLRFGCDYTMDIMDVTPATFGDWRPDIILASPPCEAFSVMTIGRNWGSRSSGDGGPFRRTPKTDKAALAMRIVQATGALIADLRPAYFVIENPRAMLRKLPMLAHLERRTVTYCQYGERFMKPTDLWGGFPPSFTTRAMCKKGSDCHVAAPRGSRTGIQGHGVLVPRAAGWRKTAEERIAAAPPKSHLPDLIHHNLISQEIYGTANPREVAALRAKVPDELALAVIIAAEHDLAHNAMPIPTTLWGAA